MKKMPNIEFLLNMAKKYLAGKITPIDFTQNFGYEIEKRYQKMCKEDEEYAELIYTYLIEDGLDQYPNLSDREFLKLMQHQYDEVIDIAAGGFL